MFSRLARMIGEVDGAVGEVRRGPCVDRVFQDSAGLDRFFCFRVNSIAAVFRTLTSTAPSWASELLAALAVAGEGR